MFRVLTFSKSACDVLQPEPRSREGCKPTGAGCSKLTTSLVNVSLNFQT